MSVNTVAFTFSLKFLKNNKFIKVQEKVNRLFITYILLTKREGRTGRISARGLGSEVGTKKTEG